MRQLLCLGKFAKHCLQMIGALASVHPANLYKLCRNAWYEHAHVQFDIMTTYGESA